eukprot:6297472-Prymnesium_polylepis.1
MAGTAIRAIAFASSANCRGEHVTAHDQACEERGERGALKLAIESEDEDGVEYRVGHTGEHRREHRPLGVTVRTQDGRVAHGYHQNGQ